MKIFYFLYVYFTVLGEKAKQCPYVDMKYRHCYGNETEECIDECGGDEICCHDGCTFKCVNNATEPGTVLTAKSDSDFMFCLQNNQGLRIDRSLVY